MIETIMAKENLKRAQLIKSVREKRGWTQEHLASVSGIITRTIQKREKDVNQIIASSRKFKLWIFRESVADRIY